MFGNNWEGIGVNKMGIRGGAGKFQRVVLKSKWVGREFPKFEKLVESKTIKK